MASKPLRIDPSEITADDPSPETMEYSIPRADISPISADEITAEDPLELSQNDGGVTTSDSGYSDMSDVSDVMSDGEESGADLDSAEDMTTIAPAPVSEDANLDDEQVRDANLDDIDDDYDSFFEPDDDDEDYGEDDNDAPWYKTIWNNPGARIAAAILVPIVAIGVTFVALGGINGGDEGAQQSAAGEIQAPETLSPDEIAARNQQASGTETTTPGAATESRRSLPSSSTSSSPATTSTPALVRRQPGEQSTASGNGNEPTPQGSNNSGVTSGGSNSGGNTSGGSNNGGTFGGSNSGGSNQAAPAQPAPATPAQQNSQPQPQQTAAQQTPSMQQPSEPVEAAQPNGNEKPAIETVYQTPDRR